MQLGVGSEITAWIDPVRLHFFDEETGLALR
jgi:hypothetical protein